MWDCWKQSLAKKSSDFKASGEIQMSGFVAYQVFQPMCVCECVCYNCVYGVPDTVTLMCERWAVSRTNRCSTALIFMKKEVFLTNKIQIATVSNGWGWVIKKRLVWMILSIHCLRASIREVNEYLRLDWAVPPSCCYSSREKISPLPLSQLLTYPRLCLTQMCVFLTHSQYRAERSYSPSDNCNVHPSVSSRQSSAKVRLQLLQKWFLNKSESFNFKIPV